MGSRGPAPSPHSIRGRRSFNRLNATAAPQPPLPDDAGMEWPQITREWWDRWNRSRLSRDFTEGDWEELLVAARLHAAMWTQDDLRAAAELRQRLAKFGATPADRQRLRVDMVAADTAERRADRQPDHAELRSRYGPLVD